MRDIGNNTAADARVEMTFWLSDKLYAIEQTGIEPFDDFMEHQNRARDLFEPLEAGAAGCPEPAARAGCRDRNAPAE